MNKRILIFFVGMAIILLVRNAWVSQTTIWKKRKEFEAKQVHGKIMSIKSLNRGLYELEVENQTSGVNDTYDIRLNSFIDEHHIQVGDSMAKPPKSKDMIFFKKMDGTYQAIPYK